MLIKEAIAYAVAQLDNFSSKQLEARVLLAHVLKLSPELLLARYNEEIFEGDKLKFLNILERRRAFEPIAYITGKKEFYGLDFLVNKDVLIPRPDTEILVEEVIKVVTLEQDLDHVTCPRILELGTGSGAIAVSLVKNIEHAEIVATDISPAALKIAKKNALLNNVIDRIVFIKSDWYTSIPPEKFDFIISNPPYITEEEKVYMAEETMKYEPESALFANYQGMENYDKIVKDAGKFLKKEGTIFLEIGFDQADSVSLILEKNKFAKIQIFKDLSEQNRVITAKYMC